MNAPHPPIPARSIPNRNPNAGMIAYGQRPGSPQPALHHHQGPRHYKRTTKENAR